MAPILDSGAVAEGAMTPEVYRDEAMLATLEAGNSWTLLSDEGAPIACGGIMVWWQGRYLCWAYLNAGSGGYMVAITKMVKKILGKAGPGRYELVVKADFAAGHRWAKMLGFEVEAPVMAQYGPNGEDCTGYVRIQ